MKEFHVTVVATVQAKSEQEAWDYGQGIVSRLPQAVVRRVVDSGRPEMPPSRPLQEWEGP